MSNPFNWHFPQRNETMYMATLGKSIPIQNRQLPPPIAHGNHHFKETIFQAASAGLKYLPTSLAKTSQIHLLSNQFLAATS